MGLDFSLFVALAVIGIAADWFAGGRLGLLRLGGRHDPQSATHVGPRTIPA